MGRGAARWGGSGGPGRPARGRPRDPDRRRRDDPHETGARRGDRRRRVRRPPARRRPRRRDGDRPRDRPARTREGPLVLRRTRGRTGSGSWPTSTSRPASAAGRSSSSRTTRRAGPRSGATSCSPSRSGPVRTECSGCRIVRASGRPSTRSRSGGSPRDGPEVARSRRLGIAGGRDPAGHRCVRRRPLRPGRLRQDVHRHRAARRAADRRGRGRRRGGCRPGRHRRPDRVRRPPLERSVAEGPQALAPALGRTNSRRPRAPCAPRIARCRQAHPRHPRRRRPELRHDDPVVRGDDRQVLRRDRADRTGRAVAHHPRAARCRRGDRALELPADHLGLEARGGAGGRQLAWS